MKRDMKGFPLTEYQVVVDPVGRILTVESFLPSGQVRCRNGCLFVHWEPEQLKCVDFRGDLT